MNKSTKTLFVGALMSGLVSGSIALAENHEKAAPNEKAAAKHAKKCSCGKKAKDCKCDKEGCGKNDCKKDAAAVKGEHDGEHKDSCGKNSCEKKEEEKH